MNNEDRKLIILAAVAHLTEDCETVSMLDLNKFLGRPFRLAENIAQLKIEGLLEIRLNGTTADCLRIKLTD